MGKCEKPELSDSLKRRLREMLNLLRTRYYTKEELQLHFATGERQVRDMISMLAKYVPVVSTSRQRGYKVATSKAELEDVVHCWQEFDSRISELEERKKALIEFWERVKENL